jgi:ABC-type multidrug transport system fused ATPase/permease subunit
MVLDKGRIAELDTPQALLADEGSAFRRLVEQSTDREVLLEMVRGGQSVT